MPAALQPRAQVIASLLRAFRRNGYDGASLSRLSEATGLRRASLYHHFPGGKEDMARAVVISAVQSFRDVVLAPLQEPGTPEQRLAGMAAALSAFYDGGKDACILALMTVGEGRDVLAPEVRVGLQGWIDALSSVIEDAGQPEAVARERAQNAVARIQGALVLARGLGETAVFERTVEDLPRDLLT
nr:TetR/AcrR family transcriptional regulator [uncultured Sphingosinicella sp.]